MEATPILWPFSATLDDGPRSLMRAGSRFPMKWKAIRLRRLQPETEIHFSYLKEDILYMQEGVLFRVRRIGIALPIKLQTANICIDLFNMSMLCIDRSGMAVLCAFINRCLTCTCHAENAYFVEAELKNRFVAESGNIYATHKLHAHPVQIHLVGSSRLPCGYICPLHHPEKE